MSLQRKRGTYCVSSRQVNEMAAKYVNDVPVPARQSQINRDGEHSFHITVLSPDEVSQVESSGKLSVLNSVNQPVIFDLGIAHLTRNSLEGWYVVIFSPELQKIRAQLGLPEKEFHITLGYYKQDLMCIAQSASISDSAVNICYSIIKWNSIPSLLSLSSYLSSNNLFIPSARCPILFIQLKVLFDELIYYLLESSESHLLANSVSPASFVLNPKQRLDVLKELGRYFLGCKEEIKYIVYLEDIGWYFFQEGYFIGLKLLLHAFLYKTNGELIELSPIMSSFPWKVNIQTMNQLGVPKLKQHIQELNNTLIMPYVQNWHEERMIFVLDESSRGILWSPLPRNFGWVKLSLFPTIPDCLQGYDGLDTMIAGSAYPSCSQYVTALHSIGIQHIVTVHEEGFTTELLQHCKEHACIQGHHIPVIDRTPPTIQQLQQIVKKLSEWILFKKEKVLIHCQGGIGRTNTVIIAWLMAIQQVSLAKVLFTLKLPTQPRRKILLTDSQEDCLKNAWYEYVLDHAEECSAFSVSSNISSETTRGASYATIAEELHLPDVFLFCGLPASGKSTFVNSLLAMNADYFLPINRDTLRDSKSQYEDMITKSMHALSTAAVASSSNTKFRPHMILMDGCFLSTDKRKECMQTLKRRCQGGEGKPLRIWCIAFQRAIQECKERIQVRRDHPTIPMGTMGVKIIDEMSSQWQVPTVREGFEKIVMISSDVEMNTVLTSLRVPLFLPSTITTHTIPTTAATTVTATVTPPPTTTTTTTTTTVAPDNDKVNTAPVTSAAAVTTAVTAAVEFVKFPRTPHLLNLGAATRDDKILSPQVLSQWIAQQTPLLIEEKMDGANLGLWISSATQQIEIYNRAHSLLNGGHLHKQFEYLFSTWLPAHSAELWDFLIPDEEILYGEWVYMIHSVCYNALPDYFLAYDLYSIRQGCFLSREVLEERIARKGVSIAMVPVVYRGAIQSQEQLLAMVYGLSHCSIDLLRTSSSGSTDTVTVTVEESDGKVNKGQKKGKELVVIPKKVTEKDSVGEDELKVRVPREGVVIRYYEEGNSGTVDGKVLGMRAKVVRDNFTAAIEDGGRWDAGTKKMRFNQLHAFTSKG